MLLYHTLLQIQQATCKQYRINDSSKCSNCYGTRAFGGPTVRCVQFFFYYMQGWILEFGSLRQTLRKGPIFYTRYTKTSKILRPGQEYCSVT